MNELSKSELTSISLLVDNYLRRPGSPAEANSGQHFDEDALSAFVEGALSEKESAPMVRHLVGCGLCRRFTAELSALRVEFGEIDENQMVTPPEPSNIRQFLAALAERIGLTAEDDAVFAYHLPAEDFRPKEDAEKPDEEEKE